jgi:tetratricopeptide (TPR) repeat protein
MKTKIAIIGALTAVVMLAQTQPKLKSQKEGEAIQAIFNAQDADTRIKLVEEFLTKFADTEFKAVALQIATQSAEQKNDYPSMVIYAERTLEADANNFDAMLRLANGIAKRTGEHDLDKAEKLGKAEKYAKTGIDLAKAAPKPRPDLPDADWQNAKNYYIAMGHEALGHIATHRKAYDQAITHFTAAIVDQAEPATVVHLANAYINVNKPDQAILELDKLKTVPDLHPQIKAAADSARARADKMKSVAGAAGKATAPATSTPPNIAPAK